MPKNSSINFFTPTLLQDIVDVAEVAKVVEHWTSYQFSTTQANGHSMGFKNLVIVAGVNTK